MVSGVSLNPQAQSLQLEIIPAEVKDKITAKSLMQLVRSSYPGWVIVEHEIAEVAKQLQSVDPTSKEAITAQVAEAINYKVEFSISDDELSADVQLTTPQGGKHAEVKNVLAACKKAGILRGISRKNIARLVKEARSQAPGSLLDAVVAKGLPARNGKSSKSVPLFENLHDKFRAPQGADRGKVDMRDFGEITSVKPGQPLLRFRPPTKGRNGYTITGKPVLAKEGEWKSKKIGKGTVISPDDHRLVLADIEGIPKFENGSVTVDDTFTSKGCNVKTGNIIYEGNVLINGDVTDGMKVEVTGDIIVNGYVESATLIAGGDITITQGATGKMSEDLCQSTTTIRAGGDIHVQQGRGLLISGMGNVSVAKQLAFCNIACMGNVFAGPEDKPNGSIFASDIKLIGKLRVGKLGAVSGSKVMVSFGSGYEKLNKQKARLSALQEQLTSSISKHRQTLTLSENKEIPESVLPRLNELKKLFQSQQKSLRVVEKKLAQTEKLIESFEDTIGVETFQKLFHGVQLSFNETVWEASEDKNRAKVSIRNRRWQYEPMV